MQISTSKQKQFTFGPYWIVFGALSIFSMAIIWANTFLPLMDLPEHVAQVSLARHFNDAVFPTSSHYYFDWFTPYLTGVLGASALSYIIGVFPAVKIILSVAILGLPLSLLFLIRRTHGDNWWSLLGFPLAFGYNYVLGHLNYLVAMPISVVFLALAFEAYEHPSPRRLVLVYFLSWMLWFSHGYLYTITLLLTAPFFLAPTNTRAWAQKMGIYTLMLALPLLWWVFISGTEINYRNESLFDFNPIKLVFIPNTLLSENFGLISFTVALGLLSVLIAKSRPTLHRVPWMPLILFFILYYFLPYNLRGAAHFGFQRISFLLIPLLILSRSFSQVKLTDWTFSHLALIGLCLGWLGLSYTRAQAFNQECKSFVAIAEKIEPHKRVFPLLFQQKSPNADGRPYRYFSAYLTTLRGSELNFSFAMQPPQWIRKKMDLSTYKLQRTWHWEPNTFRWELSPDYDYYLVHWPNDLSEKVFKEAGDRVQKIAQEGNWWLYRTVDKQPKL